MGIFVRSLRNGGSVCGEISPETNIALKNNYNQVVIKRQADEEPAFFMCDNLVFLFMTVLAF